MPSGRPKKDKNVKKIQVTVALTPEIHQIISGLAEKSFRSKTQYIEMIVIEHVEKLKLDGHFQGGE